MPETRPTNLLFICSDEHTRKALGCYGASFVKTPNLDALAARGTRFTNAYTNTPICVPARACLATGRYAHRIDSWDNATPYVGTEAPSWGHRLTEQGHRVTTIGKLHYRKVDDPSGFPEQRLPMHVLDGVGDLYGLLRGEMPVRPQSRNQVLDAHAGEVEYTRYDRAIAQEAAQWLREAGASAGQSLESSGEKKPWALFVSFVEPHFPLAAPQEYLDLYPPDSLPLPVNWHPNDWPHHPAIDAKRAQQALDKGFDERTLRNALATYYAMVTLLDAQIGSVLNALREAGLEESTRIVYTTDHGDMMGEHGLWWKSAMYEGACAVPLIMAGPDVPAGKTVRTPVSLVDCFPTIVEAVGARLTAEDTGPGGLDGRSLLQIAREPDRDRSVLSEYHAIFSHSGIFMLRHGRYKYVEYVGYPSQLFDLDADPDETRDLAGDPAHAGALVACAAELRRVLAPETPEEIDARAQADQRRRIEAAGGVESVLAGGVRIPYTPAPAVFAPANPGQ
jgi:choline-sulfatase